MSKPSGLIVNQPSTLAAPATVEGQMIGGVLGKAPVAGEIWREPIVVRVGRDRQGGKRWRGE
jgi:hypothetical protein